MTDVEYPDLPNGWTWWSGNRGGSYYTRWFGTEYQMGGPLAGAHGLGGYEGDVHWDDGGEHHVLIYPITGIKEDGDPRIADYPEVSGSYDTEQEAVNAVPDLIEKLKEETDD